MCPFFVAFIVSDKKSFFFGEGSVVIISGGAVDGQPLAFSPFRNYLNAILPRVAHMQ